MVNGSLIAKMLCVLVIVFLIVNAVYFVVYKKIINQRIQQGVTSGKKMIAPGRLMIITLLLALVVFGAWISLRRMSVNESENISQEYLQAKYDFEVFTPEEMKSGYLSMYSMEKNPGYERKEEVIGDVKFTYFVSKEPFDLYHPSYIIFAEYIGTDTDIVADGFQGDYCTNQDVVICGKGAAGNEKTEYLCVMGSASIDCTFSFTYYLYDTTELEEKDNAVTYSTLKIRLEGR